MAYIAHPTVVTGQTWTASNQNTYVRDNFIAGVPDIFTTKGDIVVASGADTAIRLGVGSDEQIPIADSSETGGIKWTNLCAQICLSAAGITPEAANGCGDPEPLYATTNKQAYKIASFAAGTAAEEKGNWSFPLPEDYNGGAFKVMIFWQQASTTTKRRVAWSVQGVAIANGGVVDVPWGTAVQINCEGGSAGKTYISSLTDNFVLAGTPAAGKEAFIRLVRKTSDTTNDNLTISAQLKYVQLFYDRG